MMKKLVIIRGLPGSGKSHLAYTIIEKYSRNNPDVLDSICCSTDGFWQTCTKAYDFKPELLGIAHQWNISQVARWMMLGTQFIVVDNTNCTVKEMIPYIELAGQFGYLIEIREPITSWAKNPEECYKKCSHNVPLETIQAMWKKWQNVDIRTY